MLNSEPNTSQASAPAPHPGGGRPPGGRVAEALDEPEPHPGEPLLRDPPPPPGTSTRSRRATCCEDPFASRDAQPMADAKPAGQEGRSRGRRGLVSAA